MLKEAGWSLSRSLAGAKAISGGGYGHGSGKRLDTIHSRKICQKYK